MNVLFCTAKRTQTCSLVKKLEMRVSWLIQVDQCNHNCPCKGKGRRKLNRGRCEDEGRGQKIAIEKGKGPFFSGVSERT